MNNASQRGDSRVARLAASAAAVTAAVGAAALIMAAQANAAQPVRAHLQHGLLTIQGTKASDTIALRLDSADPRVLQVDAGDDGSPEFSFPLARIGAIAVAAGAGDDLVRFDESNGAVNATIPTAIAGEEGNDTIAGGSGAETLLGGTGNDSIDGNRGSDVAFMGAGDDSFVWDPGDGSDAVEGEDGADSMVFNGAGNGQTIDLSANGARLKLFRNLGNVTMDTDGVERIDVNPLGAADLVTVNDLGATAVGAVNVDLAGSLGGAVGDGQPDRVLVKATDGGDTIDVSGGASGVAVAGLKAPVTIAHQEPIDALGVSALGGDDRISATGLAAQAIGLTLDGGTGDDTIAGGAGAETMRGNDGNDSIDGNRGNDVASMGAGDDSFVWDPGDGSDTVEGDDGADAMVFNGAGNGQTIDLSADGSRLKLFRNLGNVTMDTDGVERIDVNPLGGADLVTVNDLGATDVSAVNVDLALSLGSDFSDGEADRVVVNGTEGDDAIDVGGSAAELKVSGLAATVGIFHSDPADDRLDINTDAGADSVESIGLVPGTIQLFVDGVLVP